MKRMIYKAEEIEDMITDDNGIIVSELEVNGPSRLNGNVSFGGQVKGIENLVDIDGHYRFISEDGEPLNLLTDAKCAWSLNGSNLMVELSATIAKNVSIPDFIPEIASFYGSIPTWLLNKISASSKDIVEQKDFYLCGDDGTSEAASVRLKKYVNSESPEMSGLYLSLTETLAAATQNRYLRIHFDLLID